MTRRTRAVLAALLAAGILFAASCGGPAGPSPEAGAIRGSDVPAGWSHCGWSGSISDYLAAAQKVDSASADSVQRSWTAQQKLGARSSDVTEYVARHSDCATGMGNDSGPSALTWTIAYGSPNDAQRGYEAGVLGFPTPDPGRIQAGLQVGTSTGLGVDSWTLAQNSPSPHLFVAWWRHGAFANFLVVTGLASTDANPIALRVDKHMPR